MIEIVTLVEGYLLVGVLSAIAFVFLGGAARVAPGVKGSSLMFRLMILPGCIALWPIVLLRWLRGAPK